MTQAQTQVRDAAVPAPRRQEHPWYRAHLDGLRTIAVYLVVAFHTGLFGFRGGFIGVDIFFVLSGFLVTSILVRDLTAVGRVDVRRFYSRRVRRILPAACVTLLVTALVYAAIASPAEMLDAVGGFRAAFIYVANWHFIQQATDYFAADVNANPVLHFWSLAVEEQFYLLWPLLISVLFLVTAKVGRWRWWLLRALVAALAFGSIVEAFHVGTHDLARAYYGTDTRAYQLLAGALVALAPQLSKLPGRLRAGAQATVPFVLAGLVFLGTSALDMSPITRGALVTLLAVALIVGLENAHRGVTKAGLGSAPLTYLGRISYGTYLWHWPVIVVISHEYTIGHAYLFVFTCVIATTLAGISFHLMEHPLRTSRRLDAYRVPIVAAGLAISIFAGVVLIPAILDAGSGAVTGAAEPGGFNSKLRLLDWRKARSDIPSLPDCLGKPVDQCIVVHGTGKTLLLMGDSHARMWVPAFTQIAQIEKLTFAVAIDAGCPWQRDLQYNLGAKIADECRHHQADWYTRVVPQLDPDILVLVHQAYDDPARPHGMVGPDGKLRFPTDAAFERTLADASTSSLRTLRRAGRTVVLAEPVPVSMHGYDTVSCLSQGRAPKDCAFRATGEPTGVERFYRSIARNDTVTVNLDKLVCPRLPVCDAVIGNIIVRRDASHLTATFARALAPQLEALLHAQHVLGRS